MAGADTPFRIGRRSVVAAGFAAAIAGAAQAQQRQQQRSAPPASQLPAVVFVHGNGDTAALWHTTIWRFEANGWPRNLLQAIDFSYPTARSDDSRPQPFRSSTSDQREELAAFVKKVLAETRRRKVVLVGSSRGGNAIRNFLKNGGGVEATSHAVLCGCTNHGVIISDTVLKGSEFNGAAPFLRQLNDGPTETLPGVAFLTLRSDKLDKYAQPDGQFIGMPGKPTGISYDAPALKGATNLVLPGLDHREVAFDKLAFQKTYEFIIGRPPATLFIAPEREPVLNGRVTGVADEGVYTNLPVAGATVEVWEVDGRTGERKTLGPVHRRTTGADGVWGPFKGRQDAYYEFVIAVSGSPITHIYRSPFLRSSDVIHLRPGVFGKDDDKAGAVVVMTRPRGYFGHGRDKFTLDGKVPSGINEGVPGTSTGKLLLPEGPTRTVVAAFNLETIPTRTWPVKDNRLVLAEFHN
ncbi:alpha/beta fold hydrolase [Vineibacter terrae]|uniref:alpha/beta fold hydrolase n=1 Tax=Vineibacter terrae TaxID=2586908 RepID=UPI002E354875|nr:alpha/beta fold hydrolase [Vineibacter terrae]HEX2890903.1 alpha/beta fold hydrolase [Vineibacter terrae]